MDEIIGGYPHLAFDELNCCLAAGVMYQRDMNVSVAYDKHYYEHYVRLQNTDIAKKLNEGRTAITQKYCDGVLDIGVGSGEFIKASRIPAYGYDINPVAVKWLRDEGLYVDPYREIPKSVGGLTFWDAMEHIPNPGGLLGRLFRGTCVFVSMPIFSDLMQVKRSKHYKPGEHLYYFTAAGLVNYMADAGFAAVEMTDFETRAGREGILTFAFRKR